VSTGWDGLFAVDEAIFRALNGVGANPVLDAFMVVVTTLGAVYLIGLVAIPVWLIGRRKLAVDVLVVLAIVLLVTEAVKFVVLQPRPCEVLPDVRLLTPGSCLGLDPGFPSAHASRAFAVAALLALAFTRRIWIAGVLVAGLIGISRIYLGLHWPSDVLAGALLGVALALLFVWASQRSVRYQAGRRRVILFVEGLGRWLQRA